MSTLEEAVAAALKIEGWMNEAELRWLAESASKREMVLELGAWKGRSTKVLALAQKWCFAVDLWDGEIDGCLTSYECSIEFLRNLNNEIRNGKVTPVAIPTRHVALHWTTPFFDMAFIDAGHTYQDVHLDIQQCMRVLKPGGLLCGHDYSNDYPGVQKAVQELVPTFQRAPGGDIWYKELGVPSVPGSPGTQEKRADV